jgi:exodeoxyribonuclease V alpha subunit
MKSFFRIGETLGVPWFRLYLADSLAEEYSSDSSSADRRLLRWLLVHLAIQAAGGHMRTNLQHLAVEMSEWYALPGESSSPGFSQELPTNLSAELPRLLSQGLSSGLISRLDGSIRAADDIPVPRTPLVLSADGHYLYFLKRRRLEDTLLNLLARHCALRNDHNTFPAPSKTPDGPAGELMTKLAEGRRVLLLAGGPGTGKTTAVASLLGLIRLGCGENGREFPKTALTAPTGRAAARMMESLKSTALDVPEERLTGRTLHGLLGMSPGRPPFHDERNPLDAELVVVDEASMVDLPLMNGLLRALPDRAALLLVGDPDQLPSVEAGALLGDLLAGIARQIVPGTSPLEGSVVRLSTVYRSSTVILDAAAAVRSGDLAALKASFGSEGLSMQQLSSVEAMSHHLAEAYQTLGHERLAVLSPLRRGPWGVPDMNDRISLLVGGTTSPFPGMPIVVMRNDPERNLWNGDRGLIILDGDRLRAQFIGGDHRRVLPLAVLPSWEPAWVQTIHKSQGSEFDEVIILLPQGAERLLSREILYTALTRARFSVTLFADEEAVKSALERHVVRHSRIRDWAAGPSGLET